MTHSTQSTDLVNLEILFGSPEKSTDPALFFSKIVIEFFNELSRLIMLDADARNHSDLVSFGFWCRRSNLEKLKSGYNSKEIRIGLGETFHIAPSNVPINFAFSLAFALLAGNSCTVRVPSKKYEQVDIFCRLLMRVTSNLDFQEFRERILIVRYPHSDSITQRLSGNASARLIWGGDETIRHFRTIPTSMRNIDLTFSDRYSFALFSAEAINNLSNAEMNSLCLSFYNDVYLFDQNACSSPRLIVWSGLEAVTVSAKNRFWESLGRIVQDKYEKRASHTSAKLLELCNIALSEIPVHNWIRDANYIDRISLKSLERGILDIDNRFGMFFEYALTDLQELAGFITPKVQTLIYFGFDKEDFDALVPILFLKGVDRIVPVGQALNIGAIWDGYDVPLMLSRVLEIS